MCFCGGLQCVEPVLGDQRLRRRFHRRRDTFWKYDSKLFIRSIKPLNKFIPRENRGGSYRDIGFGLGSLIDLDQSALL